MKDKWIVLGAVICVVALAAGCANKSQEDETTTSLEKALEETSVSNSTENSQVLLNQVQKPQSLQEVASSESFQTVLTPQAQGASVPFENVTTQKIQEALKNANFYTGKVDGVLGPKTKAAIKEFQSNSGLTPDGKVGPKTWQKLSTYLSGAASVAPVESADAPTN